jgi:thioredoxin 1
MSDLIVKVSDETFETEVIKSDKPVLVDFWASWCGPCKMLAPVLDQLATEYGDKVRIAKLNVDENPVNPGKLGVMSIPTLILYKGGEIKGKVVGYKSLTELKSFVDSSL